MGMIQEFQQADKERRGEVKQLQGEVANMLKDFAKGDAERRSEVTDFMRSEVTTIRSEAADMLKELAKEDTRRASEVTGNMRSAVATIHSDVADMLKDLAKEDDERRSEVAAIHQMVWGKAPARKMATPPKVAPAPPVAKLPKKMPPVGALRDRVFAYLADHPDGTKLAELEAEFGVSRIEMARIVRNLMDNNKVEKRELLYFAI